MGSEFQPCLVSGSEDSKEQANYPVLGTAGEVISP